MDKYRSHKVVEASKIDAVERTPTGARLTLRGGEALDVGQVYADKHAPRPGGYYVRYPDGYESWSPADAFEQGYTLIERESEDPEPDTMIRWFQVRGLPSDVQDVVRPWRALAKLTAELPWCAERSVALRKLLEGRDSAIRAYISLRPAPREDG